MAPFSFSDQGSLCLVKVIVVNIVVSLFRIRYLVLNWGAVLFSIISTFFYVILLLQRLVAVQQTNSGSVPDQPGSPVPNASLI